MRIQQDFGLIMNLGLENNLSLPCFSLFYHFSIQSWIVKTLQQLWPRPNVVPCGSSLLPLSISGQKKLFKCLTCKKKNKKIDSCDKQIMRGNKTIFCDWPFLEESILVFIDFGGIKICDRFGQFFKKIRQKEDSIRSRGQ